MTQVTTDSVSSGFPLVQGRPAALLSLAKDYLREAEAQLEKDEPVEIQLEWSQLYQTAALCAAIQGLAAELGRAT